MRVVENFLFKLTRNQSESNIYFAKTIFNLLGSSIDTYEKKFISFNEWLKKTLLNT